MFEMPHWLYVVATRGIMACCLVAAGYGLGMVFIGILRFFSKGDGG